MPRWFIFSALAGLSWALWAILSKTVESAHMTIAQIQLLFTAGLVPPAVAVFRRRHLRRGTFKVSGALWAVLSGLLGALGNLAFYAAFTGGAKASIVVPLTSLYPLVTVLVAWLFLKERLIWPQVAGAAVAVVAIVLLSGEARELARPSALLANAAAAKWMLYAVLALVAWGLLSVAQKLSTNSLPPELSFALFTLAFLPVAVVLLVLRPTEVGPAALAGLGSKVASLAILAGALNGIGMLASFAAYRSDGRASLVTPMAGMLTSVFTVLLAVAFLGERLGTVELAGILVAVVSAVMLTVDKVAPWRR